MSVHHDRDKKMIEQLKERLIAGGYSCVVGKGGTIRTFSRRGVADLYDLLLHDADFLQGSEVADKVVGKGAAALLALGKVQRVYASLISEPALRLLLAEGIAVDYGEAVDYIKNRTQTGSCPLEARCKDEDDPHKLLPLITRFIEEITKHS